MRVLVVGGTRFVGRHLVERLLARGHEVTVFHRGLSGGDLFPVAEHRLGDRDGDLAALAGGSWDATVDVSAYLPRQVRRLLESLDGRGGRYCYVSTVSVYADPPGPGVTEDAPLVGLDDPDVEQVTAGTYGGLKAGCERLARELMGAVLVVRPTYVVGPHDYTWRFPSWVTRLADGGRVLAPGPASAPMQTVDARDLGAFTVGLLEREDTGTYTAAAPAPPFTWGELLERVAGAVAPPGTSLVWVDEAVLAAQGVSDRDLPLWSAGDPGVWALAADPSRATAAGLSARPLAETARDTLAWARSAAGGRPAGLGLTRDAEAALLEAVGRG